jgi:hypothetical protein
MASAGFALPGPDVATHVHLTTERLNVTAYSPLLSRFVTAVAPLPRAIVGERPVLTVANKICFFASFLNSLVSDAVSLRAASCVLAYPVPPRRRTGQSAPPPRDGAANERFTHHCSLLRCGEDASRRSPPFVHGGGGSTTTLPPGVSAVGILASPETSAFGEGAERHDARDPGPAQLACATPRTRPVALHASPGCSGRGDTLAASAFRSLRQRCAGALGC